ncbi:MAG: hypothetical protein IJD64_03400 [Clostridia bacterium]|nr:hypothetical protein [Clostridia bacterium]
MNRNRRPMQYRRPLRRRRTRFPIILAIVGGVLLVLLTVLLIIGGRMYKKSQAFRETLPEEQTELETPTTPETPSLLAYPLPSLTDEALDALKQNGASAASVALNTKNGEALCDADSLSALSASAKGKGIALSGVFYLTALKENDELARFDALNDHCSVVAKALRSGLSEVMLVAPDTISGTHTQELVRFVDDLRTLVPNAVIGLSLPHGFLTDANAETVDTLSKSFSLLATDLSEADDLDTALEADLYALLRYSMRVLLPSREDNAAQIAAVKNYGVENIQILP